MVLDDAVLFLTLHLHAYVYGMINITTSDSDAACPVTHRCAGPTNARIAHASSVASHLCWRARDTREKVGPPVHPHPYVLLPARDENSTDIFRPYSRPNPFRGVLIRPYPSPDI
jgi:hypothetical protein